MTSKKNIKKQLVESQGEWSKKFDVTEYISNGPLIEKLYEEKQTALVSSIEFKGQTDKLQKRVHDLELEKQRLSIKNEDAENKGKIAFFISLIAIIPLGIGINLVTNKTNSWIGCILIVVAGILEFIAFYTRPKTKEK